MSAPIVNAYVVQDDDSDDDDGEEDDFEDDDEGVKHAAEMMLRPDRATSSGYLLASGSLDDSIKLWDAGTGALKTTLQGHTSYVWSVAFSPCGSTIASGSRDLSIKLWDAGTGALKTTLQGHTSSVISVAFCPIVERSHAVSCVRRLSRHLLPDVADVVVSFMFGRVHSGLAREAMSVESDSGDDIDDCGRDDDDDDDDEKRGEALLLGGGEEAAALGVVGEDEGSKEGGGSGVSSESGQRAAKRRRVQERD